MPHQADWGGYLSTQIIMRQKSIKKNP